MRKVSAYTHSSDSVPPFAPLLASVGKGKPGKVSKCNRDGGKPVPNASHPAVTGDVCMSVVYEVYECVV